MSRARALLVALALLAACAARAEQLVVSLSTERIAITSSFTGASLVVFGVVERAAFVGLGQKFQIWDADAYAPIEADALARVKARMTRARNGDAS